MVAQVSTTEVAAEVVMDVDVYENRRDAAATEELRPDTIYVYGTDKMATASVLGLFKGCAPKYHGQKNSYGIVVLKQNLIWSFSDYPTAIFLGVLSG